ncbi:putative transposase YbfD/YdcC [Paeniglutamicibacter psychrophenolicus]|nr:ISAs1 family transposase [Paeniglutamicibacter psychrophenolicus]MDQ0094662.1 putative transposase YbfD/YdcC [Paeniglutamicibacter psychrophenolicus]
MPSSPISILHGQLDDIPENLISFMTPESIFQALASFPDHRKPRGIRHQLGWILAVALCAVLSGAKPFTAIADWSTYAASTSLRTTGFAAPHVTTFQRVLARLDAEAFDQAMGAWVQTQVEARIIAIRVLEVRGAKNGGADRVHLMAALDHDTGTVLGQVDVGVKTNEITRLDSLLETLGDLDGRIITIDALHTMGRHVRVPACPWRPFPDEDERQPTQAAQTTQGPAIEGSPVGEPATRHRARAQEHPQDQGRHAHWRHQVPARVAGSATGPKDTATEGEEVVHRGRVSHHFVAGPPGKPAAAEHLDPGPLENREFPPLVPGRDVPGGREPDPDGCRAAGDGEPAKPGPQPASAQPQHQHRQGQPLHGQTPRTPAGTHRVHDPVSDFALALRSRAVICRFL